MSDDLVQILEGDCIASMATMAAGLWFACGFASRHEIALDYPAAP